MGLLTLHSVYIMKQETVLNEKNKHSQVVLYGATEAKRHF